MGEAFKSLRCWVIASQLSEDEGSISDDEELGDFLDVFSRRAWLTFSKALDLPMSNHKFVLASFCKNLPGGSWDRINWNIERAIIIFSRFVRVTYTALLQATMSRKLEFPTWRLAALPLPDRTSLLCGFAISFNCSPPVVTCWRWCNCCSANPPSIWLLLLSFSAQPFADMLLVIIDIM